MRSLILRPAGDVSVETVDRYLAGWARDVDQRKPPVVTIDLTNVRLLDGEGLQALVRLHDSVRDHGGILRVQGASDRQHEILERTGWSQVLGSVPRSDPPRGDRPRLGRRAVRRVQPTAAASVT